MPMMPPNRPPMPTQAQGVPPQGMPPQAAGGIRPPMPTQAQGVPPQGMPPQAAAGGMKKGGRVTGYKGYGTAKKV